MESHTELEALRIRATNLLQELLQRHAGKPVSETASSIINELAFQDDNAVKDLFAATSAAGKGPPPSPKGTLKSRSSKSILRLGGRLSKSSSSDGKPQTPTQQDATSSTSAGPSNANKGPAKSAQMSTYFSTGQKPTKGCSSMLYQCIMCNEVLSSKGVCKRHLEDQHVSPKMYKCEKCSELFYIKSRAKDHVKSCGKGVFLYVVVKQEEKRAYACEFTGHVFSSMKLYLEHLTSLSEKTEGRPTSDPHRKLYGLLDRPGVQPYVAEVSSRLYGSRSAWRNLQWDPKELGKAIAKLEYAMIHDNGTLEFGKHVGEQQRIQDIQAYMYSLLCAGEVRPSSRRTLRPGSAGRSEALSRSSSTSFGSNGTVTPKVTSSEALSSAPPLPTALGDQHQPQPTLAQMSTPLATTHAPPTSNPTITPYPHLDVKGKRHLSDYSRFYEPERHPPGPPLPSSLPQLFSVQDSGHTTPVNSSTTSLPFRQPDSAMESQSSLAMSMDGRHNYTPSLGTSITSISSDAASDSTMMSKFPEPELVTPMSFDYNMWQGQPNMTYSLPYNHSTTYSLAPGYHFPTDGSSTRTPSMSTEQTFVVDYSAAEQKSLNFGHTEMANLASYGTFLLDDEDPPENQPMQ